ncbi:SusC/RagA family TonB-linked outer membrane protein [Catalinimonas niigatensis]|uniref:SusC/RagA family TonB-linked outer membrane protein n=1 Tax=Catalinimonas niigatensis TaxID=1397264 RepID=UPI00266545BB|nr:TonB-dependent receptor [Catalinimonas niigatensis]WPP49199.1 TonB-dependent receptor [Catalinimonas niigatensis]
MRDISLLKPKLTTILLLLLGFSAYSQQLASVPQDSPTALYHPQDQEMTLKSLLLMYEKKYKVSIVFNSDAIGDQKVSISDPEENRLENLLGEILGPLGLRYKKIDEDVYVIQEDVREKNKVSKVDVSNVMADASSRPLLLEKLQSRSLAMQSTMEQTISGKVTDAENGDPLPGVNILAKGTTTGTVTGIDGNYRITVADDVSTLVFSSIGYLSQEVEVNNQSVINVSLGPDVQSLSEVVVVGYGAVQKRDLTGSVSKIEGDALTNIPTPRVDQLLQGRAPGVNVTSVSGAPGARASIRIRGGNSIQGDNEPLYVIDGFIAGTDFNLNNINVNDIESIDILKDASAISIYGTRGANGVILITTKDGSGATGGKPNVSLNAYTGFQQLARKIDFLDGPERAAYGSEYANFSGESNPFVDESLIANTDWQDLITRTAPIHNMDVSVRGNAEKVNYFISGNYLNQQGIIQNSGIKRYAVRANLDFELTDKIRLGTRINVTHVRNDNNLVNLWETRRALTSFPLYQEDGSYWDEDYVQGGPFDNPVALLNMQTNYTFVNNLLGNFYLEVEPFEGVTIRSTIGPQLNWRKQNRFESGFIPSRAAAQRGGRAVINNGFGAQILQENTITYQKEINPNHRFNLLGGFTWQTARNENFFAQTDGLPNDGVSFDVLELGNPETFQVRSSFDDPFQIVSWIGRANYTLMDKFLFTLAGRVDGASRFSGANNQYAFFPSAAVAWRLDEESFIQSLGVFDDLKLRMSYGRAGSQAINAFSTLALYNTGQVIFNDAPAIAVRRGRPANPDLRWETTSQFDIGLEAGFFNNRLTFEMDYYYKKTEDLLLNREIPRQTGFSQRLENIGSLQNQGLELLINSVNVDNKNFSWSTTLTLAGNRSKVLELGGIEEINIYNLEQGGPGAKLIVGEPIGVFTGLEYLGTWKSQEELDASGYSGLRTVVGGPRFNDTSGDGLISFNDDFVIIGNPEPLVFGGINNRIRWKNFNLDILFQGTWGNDVYNEFSQRGFFGRSDQNIYAEARNRWTEANPTSDIPRAGGTISISDIPSNSVLVEDGSHLRLKNVQLSYTVPTASVSWLNQLNLYVGGTNLFLLSSFRGYDPEATRIGPDSEDTYSGVIRGIIRAEYPNARTFTFGLNANF